MIFLTMAAIVGLALVTVGWLYSDDISFVLGIVLLIVVLVKIVDPA